jgi:hypothetical protein
LTCVQSLWWRPSDARCAGCGLAAAWLIQVYGWRTQCLGWWALRLRCPGECGFLFPVLSGWASVSNTSSWSGVMGTT